MKRLTAVALTVVPLLLLLTCVLVAYQFEQDRDLRDRVHHSYETRAAIIGTLSTLQDLETGQRGYMVTGRPSFLEPYEEGKVQLDNRIAALRDHLGSEVDGEINIIADLVREKAAFVDEAVRLHAAGREAEAARLVSTGRGKQAMDDIRRHLSALDRRERSDLAESIARADAGRRHLQWLTFAIQLLLILLIAGAAYIIKRSLSAQYRALRDQADIAARQAAIFDSATDAIITHSRAGIIESLNPAASRLYGYEGKELVGQHVDMLFETPPDPEDLQSFLGRLARNPAGGASKPQMFVGRRKSGGTFPVETVISPVRISSHELFLAVLRDVTERQRVDQMKTEFVSVVSHELRTPLTSIAGSLGLLSGGAGGELPERADRLIRIAHANSERLVRLINDILDIEKIESGKMSFDVRPVLLRPIVEQAIQSNRAFADGFGISFELLDGEDALVLADPDRLMQVFTNLLSNAAKFSPRGEKVEIAITRSGGAWRTAITDKGVGIPEEFKGRIFSKFAQADSSDTRAKGGTGLGLSIVREIVTRLKGGVGFTSEAGAGTTFHVDLPAAEDGKAQKQETALALLCDRDCAGAHQAKAALERAGFRCVLATSSDALRELTTETAYSALIMYLPLPSEDMIDLIQDLRGTDRYASTPILVVATAAEHGHVSQVIDVADWLEKPISIERLEGGIRSILKEVSILPHILHVEDDLDVLRVVASAFEGRARLRSVTGLEDARRALRGEDFDLVILDLALPGGSGVELLPDMRNSIGQPVPVVIFSAHESDPELARRVEATLTKSRASLDNLVDTVELLVARAKRSKQPEDE